MRRPVVVLALVGLAGCLLAALLVGLGTDRRGPQATASSRAVPGAAAPGSTARVGSRQAAAARVLHSWDARRSRAWAAGSPAALASLYLDGSAAGRADVALLRSYLARGYTVRGLRTQLLAVAVLAERPRRLRLRVTDRLAAAVAVGPEGGTRLPADAATTRELVLVRDLGRWRVASVSRAPR
jgi:hypothetical protein